MALGEVAPRCIPSQRRRPAARLRGPAAYGGPEADGGAQPTGNLSLRGPAAYRDLQMGFAQGCRKHPDLLVLIIKMMSSGGFEFGPKPDFWNECSWTESGGV